MKGQAMGKDKFISGWCLIENNRVSLNGQTVFEAPGIPFADFAKQAYQHAETSYAKFFKMDNLSKLAFLAADILLKDEVKDGEENNIALLFANKSSSLDTDVKHHESIADRENYFPSPAVFVYTLPNICMGEISIRHRLFTENSFFIFAQFNAGFFVNYADILMDTGKAGNVLCGWVEFYKDNYKAFMYLVSDSGTMVHTQQNIQKLYIG
ncbi:MAG: 3-oxoacyl-ACP synthase [Flavobacterium sp.]